MLHKDRRDVLPRYKDPVEMALMHRIVDTMVDHYRPEVDKLEERIDEMIESKRALAESVLGTGEGWLTELDTAELPRLLERAGPGFFD